MDEEGNSCCTLTDYGTQHSGTSFSDVTVSSHIAAATITDATMNEITFEPTINQSCNQTGIEEIESENSFFISPNPADQLTVISYQFTTKENAELKVFDVTDKLIYQSAIVNSQSEMLHVAKWQNGVYIC